MSEKSQKELIVAMDNAINGVYKMSEEMPDLVEASNNIARVMVKNGEIKILVSYQVIGGGKQDEVSNSLKTAFEDRVLMLHFQVPIRVGARIGILPF